MAYRDLARRYHPDAKGDHSAARMAQINDAWRVLSDPARRAAYDATRRSSVGAEPTRSQAGATATAARPTVQHAPPAPLPERARFPWRFMLVIAAIGIAFVLVNAALTKPGKQPAPDNLLQPGSCVDIQTNGDALEVPCDGGNQGVVDSLIAVDGLCPAETEGHRDHQGLGQVCVRLAISG